MVFFDSGVAEISELIDLVVSWAEGLSRLVFEYICVPPLSLDGFRGFHSSSAPIDEVLLVAVDAAVMLLLLLLNFELGRVSAETHRVAERLLSR